MRVRLGRRSLAVLAAIAAVAPAAAADDLGPDVRYWPLREIHFPVPLEKIQAFNPAPTKLRFYAASNRGQFKQVSEKSLANLDVIDADRNKRGFKYVSPADGEYDFALQFVYANGDTQPRDSELPVQYRVVFDTRPPAVRVAPLGTSGIDWYVDDENPDPDGVKLEHRRKGSTKWVPVKAGRPLNLRDQYTYNRLTEDDQIEVRVLAVDRAGNETASRLLALPSAGGGQGLPAGFNDPRRGGRDDALPRAQIEYVHTLSFTVEGKLSKVTRSGVKAFHLWVNDGRTGWKKGVVHPAKVDPNDPAPAFEIPYTAPKDGLYGFIIIPENNAGGKQEDPRPNDPAQILVEADTEKPFVKVLNVKVSPGGLAGPRVEIEWKAEDKNLLTDPITLEYAESPAGPWQPISKDRLANANRYVWEVDDPKLWKFNVRARATDLAGNSSEHLYEKEVIIDLEKPSAEPVKVHPGTGGQARSSERPAPAEATPASIPNPITVRPTVTPAPTPAVPVAPTSPLPGVGPITLPAEGGFQPIPALPAVPGGM